MKFRNAVSWIGLSLWFICSPVMASGQESVWILMGGAFSPDYLPGAVILCHQLDDKAGCQRGELVADLKDREFQSRLISRLGNMFSERQVRESLASLLRRGPQFRIDRNTVGDAQLGEFVGALEEVLAEERSLRASKQHQGTFAARFNQSNRLTFERADFAQAATAIKELAFVGKATEASSCHLRLRQTVGSPLLRFEVSAEGSNQRCEVLVQNVADREFVADGFTHSYTRKVRDGGALLSYAITHSVSFDANARKLVVLRNHAKSGETEITIHLSPERTVPMAVTCRQKSRSYTCDRFRAVP